MDTRLHHLSLSPAQTRSMPVRLQEYALLSINTTAFGWPGEKLLGGAGGARALAQKVETRALRYGNLGRTSSSFWRQTRNRKM